MTKLLVLLPQLLPLSPGAAPTPPMIPTLIATSPTDPLTQNLEDVPPMLEIVTLPKSALAQPPLLTPTKKSSVIGILG
jgi:hypothetical protein